MSDTNRFVNVYIDIVVKQLHDYLTESLQNKTEIKLLKEILSEKDALINNLNEQNKKFNKNDNQVKEWEQKYNSMVNKVSHIDTLLKQVNDMRQSILEKDAKISELENKIQTLSVTTINKRKKKSKDVTVSLLTVSDQNTSTEKSVDDF